MGIFNKLFGRKKDVKRKKIKEKHDKVRGKQGPIVRCSKCGRHLKPIGSIFDHFEGGVFFGQGSEAGLEQSLAGFEQWLGWVCTKCHRIFCSECEMPKMDQPSSAFRCPNCGRTLQAATAMNLKQIGKLK